MDRVLSSLLAVLLLAGRDAAGGILDYYGRVPSDRSKRQTVPSQPRPYPPPH